MGKHPKRRDRFTPAPVAKSVASSAASPGGKGVSAPAPKKNGPSRELLWAALALGLLAFLVYANSFSAGLVLDNSVVIADDGRIKEVSWENVKNIFTHNYWWPAYESNLYRPLTTLSYMFNYAVLGSRDQVASYHIVNFLLHWANITLVLLIVRRLSGNLALAALAAGIFAVHPINVEAVTNIVGRADLFATCFILLGGWCYIKAGDDEGQFRVPWLVGAAICAFIGGFTKESAVIIFPFVVLYDMVWRWPGLPGPTFGERLKQAWRQFVLKGWSAVLAGILLFLGFYSLFWMMAHTPVFGEIFADNPIAGANSWFQGRLTAIKVLGRYLALLVYPHTLSSDYSYNQIPLYGLGSEWEDAQCWLALAVVAALLGIAFWLRRTQPLLAWGIALYFLTQILTSNLFFPIGTIMAERSQYLPSVGYAVVAAQLLWWIGGALSRLNGRLTQTAAAGVLAGLLILALGARTFTRNEDWQNMPSLWKSILAASPDSFKAYKGYADTVWREVGDKHTGDKAAEEKALDQTIQIAEHGLKILDTPPLPISRQDNTLYQDLGQYYRVKGDYLAQRGNAEAARQFYQKSLAVLFRARDVDHWVNQTSRESQLKRGRPADQIPDVGNYRIYILINLTYDKLGDWKNAEAAANYVVRLAPTQGVGYRLVARALAAQGHAPDAVVEVLQALLLDMHDGGCWNELISYYRTMDVKPFPLTPLQDTYSIDEKNPLVREEINQAGVELIHRIEEGKLFDLAKQLQITLIQNIRIPAERFEHK